MKLVFLSRNGSKELSSLFSQFSEKLHCTTNFDFFCSRKNSVVSLWILARWVQWCDHNYRITQVFLRKMVRQILT